ncbi:hypothetical protein Ae356Ps1_0845 [Pseudonocardia sp. Ae356_Ps1]|nr:hypothetical protein Ae356Ps1_0845 [Pseudonocardia sp. Ae356_Ps1]
MQEPTLLVGAHVAHGHPGGAGEVVDPVIGVGAVW